MIEARKLRWPAIRTRASRLVPILTLGLLVPGCASWNATAGRSAWTLPLAKPGARSADGPGYDSYADAASHSRPQDPGNPPTAIARASQTRGAARSGPEAGDPAEPARDGGPSRTKDSDIRVTLGRPESLPTLRDSVADPDQLLAETPATSRKPRREPASVRQESLARADDPRPPDPEIRRQGTHAARQSVPSTPPADDPDAKLRQVLADSRAKLNSLSTYQVDITRVERVGGQLQAEEDVVLNVRRNPKAVLLQWVKGPSKGREVIYSTAINNGLMYVNMGNSALPLSRLKLPIDSPMALRNSRHPISEAGLDTILDNVAKHASSDSIASRAEGKVVYKGVEKPRGIDRPCHRLERVTPQGETWQVYLDSETLMPVLVSASQTSSGELIERYYYRNFKPNPDALMTVTAFDPDKRWGEPKGLFSRLARATEPTDTSGKTDSTKR